MEAKTNLKHIAVTFLVALAGCFAAIKLNESFGANQIKAPAKEV